MDQYGIANTLVILVATGGSDRHALVIEHAMRPLFEFLQANTLPLGYCANADDFDVTTVLNAEVYSCIEVGPNDALPLLTLLKERASPVASGIVAS